MAQLNRETSITLDKDDMGRILTEEICRYNCFGQLEVTMVSMNEDGDFDLVLTPKPEESA
jgi:hypothetical protein